MEDRSKNGCRAMAKKVKQVSSDTKREVSNNLGATHVSFSADTLRSHCGAPRPSALASQATDLETKDPKQLETDDTSIYRAESAVLNPPRTRQIKRVAQNTSEGSGKKSRCVQGPTAPVQSSLASIQDPAAPVEQKPESNIGLAKLADVLKLEIVKYLSGPDLCKVICVCKALYEACIGVLWINVTLDFTKRQFPRDVTESWRKKKCWTTTKMLSIGLKRKKDSEQLNRVLDTIPPNQIEKLSFTGQALLGKPASSKFHWFFLRQERIQFQSCVRPVDDKHKPTSYSIKLRQQGKHSNLKELAFIQSIGAGTVSKDNLAWKLLDSKARASSVEVWGAIDASGRSLDCDFWARIATLRSSQGLLQEVTRIHLKDLDLTNTGAKMSEIERHTELSYLERLAISNCHGADQFLVTIQQSTRNLKSLLLHDSLNHDPAAHAYPSWYKFVDGKSLCEELCLDFVQDTASVPGERPSFLPVSVASNLKKLVLKVPTSTTDQAPEYLVETIKHCPNLTHVAFIFDSKYSPSVTRQITLEWERGVQALGILLKKCTLLKHVHVALPAALNEQKKYDIRPEPKQIAAIFAENGFKPTELSFSPFYRGQPTEEFVKRACVYKIRHNDDGITIVQAEGAEDWTTLGYSASIAERIAKVSVQD